jgi:hypothetical protein
MRSILNPFVFALVATSAAPATDAASVLYLNEGTFLSLAGPVTLESFEGLPAGTAVASLDAGPFTVSSASQSVRVRDVNSSGMIATHGSHYINWLASVSTGTLVFLFDAPATVFGVTLTDLWDSGSNPQLDVTTNGGDSFAPALQASPPLASGVVRFVGLTTETPFTALTLRTHLSTVDNVGVDEVYFNVAPIPEPAAEPLLLLGLSVLGLATRRRKG